MDTSSVILLILCGALIGAAVYDACSVDTLRRKLVAAEIELMIAQDELAKYRKQRDSRGRFTK